MPRVSGGVKPCGFHSIAKDQGHGFAACRSRRYGSIKVDGAVAGVERNSRFYIISGPRTVSGRSKRRWRYDDFNESCCHIIDEARDEPLGWQCWNGSQQSNVAGNRCSWIKDRFCWELSVWYLKVLGQHGRVTDQTGDAAISMLKDDEVKLPTPAGDRVGNLTDPPQQTQLLQQSWRHSTADIAHHHRLPRLKSEQIGRVHTHIGATNDDCFQVWQRLRKPGHQGMLLRLLDSKDLVALKHKIKTIHVGISSKY